MVKKQFLNQTPPNYLRMTQVETDSIAGVAHDAYRALCVDLFPLLAFIRPPSLHTHTRLDFSIHEWVDYSSHTHIHI